MRNVWALVYVVLIVVLAVFAVWTSKPAYDECRATGRDAGTCVLQLRYWTSKRFWGF